MGTEVSKRLRRRCSAELRDHAVKTVIELERPIAQVARELGVLESALGKWVTKWRREIPCVEQPLNASGRAQWQADRRELAEVRSENGLFSIIGGRRV